MPPGDRRRTDPGQDGAGGRACELVVCEWVDSGGGGGFPNEHFRPVTPSRLLQYNVAPPIRDYEGRGVILLSGGFYLVVFKNI